MSVCPYFNETPDASGIDSLVRVLTNISESASVSTDKNTDKTSLFAILKNRVVFVGYFPYEFDEHEGMYESSFFSLAVWDKNCGKFIYKNEWVQHVDVCMEYNSDKDEMEWMMFVYDEEDENGNMSWDREPDKVIRLS